MRNTVMNINLFNIIFNSEVVFCLTAFIELYKTLDDSEGIRCALCKSNNNFLYTFCCYSPENLFFLEVQVNQGDQEDPKIRETVKER